MTQSDAALIGSGPGFFEKRRESRLGKLEPVLGLRVESRAVWQNPGRIMVAAELGGGWLNVLLDRLDWAAITGDDETVAEILETIMLEELLAVFDDERLLRLSPHHQLAILRMAAEACRSEGYTDGPVRLMEENAVDACKGIILQDGDRWYFPGIRSRARNQARRRRDNNRRKTSPPTLNVTSAEECTHSSSSVLNPDMENQLRPAGTHARNIDALSESEAGDVKRQSDMCAGGFLFPDMDEPAPPAKPEGHRRGPEWKDLFDAIATVAGDDKRKSTRSWIAKVADDLRSGESPYTAADVLALKELLIKQPWWRRDMVISPAVIQKHIGLVRLAREASEQCAMVERCVDLAELERRARKAYLEGLRR